GHAAGTVSEESKQDFSTRSTASQPQGSVDAVGAPKMAHDPQLSGPTTERPHQSHASPKNSLPKDIAPHTSTQSATPKSVGTRRHRHDSVTSPPSSTAPGRSHSFRSAYNRVFGSSTRKTPHKDEKPEEEALRLRKMVRQQEQELEE